MKQGLLLLLAFLIVSVIFANDFMTPGPQNLVPRQSPSPIKSFVSNQGRPDTLIVTFSINPVTLTSSYYDYMIGAYNDLPVALEPDGAYFLTFHGKSTTAGLRRAYYAYINTAGGVGSLNTITNNSVTEGYSSLAIDPVTGKPVYAWHNDVNPNDVELETSTAWDAFLFGTPGVMSNPFAVIDNPTTVVVDGVTYNDNEFIWPTVQIGPSPMAGLRRIYILSRNATDRNGFAMENVLIAFADVSIDDLEFGNPSGLAWSYTTIPVLDQWNVDAVEWRRPNMGFTVGDDGRIYYVGYHGAAMINGTELGDEIYEPLLDAFVCDNYGQGTWQRYRANSRYRSWNPKDNYGEGVGIFQIPVDQVPPSPVANDSMYFDIANASHMNAVFDAASSKIHVPLLWALNSAGFEAGLPVNYYYPSFHVLRDMVFDINSHTFVKKEIYPMAGTASDTLTWQPWDEDGDWLVDEYFVNPGNPDDGYPLSSNIWPFPYWDQEAHGGGGLMFFHYNNTKISTPNEQDMMVAVWQDANRARLYNTNQAAYPELIDYADTPEIYISCSPDNGYTWSVPVSLNKVENPELAGMRPMWVYPADKVKYVGLQNGKKVGKLGIMFYDDFSWGSFVLGTGTTPPAGTNLGGNVKFMELNIVFPTPDPVGNSDQVTPVSMSMLAQNYPNPFNPETTISFNMPAKGMAQLSIYNIKGQLVNTLINGPVKSGTQKLVWNGKDNNGNNVASGIYFYKLTANGKVETRKMMLMK